MGKRFMGLDSSTQGLTAVVIDHETGEVLLHQIKYEERLPKYNTTSGFYDLGNNVFHSSPLMWAEALDLMFEDLKNQGVKLSEIVAVSGSGQQHGSVYLNREGRKILESLSPDKDLAESLKGAFSREASPIWMDSSTEIECGEIRKSLGGVSGAIMKTGSDVFERFAGPQVRAFHKRDPGSYGDTADIALVSSYMASILKGGIAPIDPGDGAGMSLMDIRTKDWLEEAVFATAPGLESKLPPVRPSDTFIGLIDSYFISKYGFKPDTEIFCWSGDNPNSLVGTGIVRPGQITISLGTSDTLFAYMSELKTDPNGEGHVFGSPTGDYMAMIVFKNASLAREGLRDKYFGSSANWDDFSDALSNTPVGNNGKIMLPYFVAEIVPRVNDPGVYRYGGLAEGDGPSNIRALVEAQIMSMHLHSNWIGEEFREIHVTGGASQNPEILRIMSDVFDATVKVYRISNSAALGAAIRAAHAYLNRHGERVSWEELIDKFVISDSEVKPVRENSDVYRELVPLYKACEDNALRNGQDPDPLIGEFRSKITS